MTWDQAGQLCFDQVQLIASHLPLAYWRGHTDWQARVCLLLSDEKRLKAELDAVMREFAARKILPRPPAGIHAFLICSRLLCAVDTVNVLLAGDRHRRVVADPDGETDEVILNWLLIETWNEWRWDTFLKLQALRSLSGDDSFYGAPSLPNYGN